jgi:hypothetical protein
VYFVETKINKKMKTIFSLVTVAVLQVTLFGLTEARLGATTNTNIAALNKDLAASNTALAAAISKINANIEALDVANALNAQLLADLTTSLRPEDHGVLKTAVRVDRN